MLVLKDVDQKLEFSYLEIYAIGGTKYKEDTFNFRLYSVYAIEAKKRHRIALSLMNCRVTHAA